MILEGLVTTTSETGQLHLAPMGPRVRPDWSGFVLRPFPTSTTFQNLKARRAGVLHVTDDVSLLARAAVGQAPAVETIPATTVAGFIIKNACRYYEFRVTTLDESRERMHIECEVVASGTRREFFGLNRAKHAVVEAAILATRLHIIPPEEVLAEYHKLRILVDKTGGPAEEEAFAFLEKHVNNIAAGERR
ncbi:DUF447 domain-containing protein [Zavarzinella formosa]|uniref:DUF447 domain-containing protein n=1 Tax=Zavarzinella formosa TaxID=360055 RepID=UPI0002EE6636|nr:DUF447 domain-containing protein [Zavarzinella formosa]